MYRKLGGTSSIQMIEIRNYTKYKYEVISVSVSVVRCTHLLWDRIITWVCGSWSEPPTVECSLILRTLVGRNVEFWCHGRFIIVWHCVLPLHILALGTWFSHGLYYEHLMSVNAMAVTVITSSSSGKRWPLSRSYLRS